VSRVIADAESVGYGAVEGWPHQVTETLYLDLRRKASGVYLNQSGFVRQPLTTERFSYRR